MNKSLKIGLAMLGSEFAFAILIGLIIGLIIIPWSFALIMGMLFITFNLVSLILILVGVMSNNDGCCESKYEK